MPSALAAAHIEAQARLRKAAAAALGILWDALGRYDDANMDRWVARAVPVAEAAKARSVHLTDAYLAAALGRLPLGIDPAAIEVRIGTPAVEVYQRPIKEVWKSLSIGSSPEQAIAAGRARAESAVAFDVQSAQRATAQEVQNAEDGIYGYRRVPDPGACEFCESVAGAYVRDAEVMPLHNHCGCTLEPITEPPARHHAELAAGEVITPDYAVREHGELGPVLQAPEDHFKSDPT